MTLNVKEFTECIQELEVFDHFYTGPLFTWSNHQGETFLAKKLDRVLINANWLITFPHSKVDFLTPEVSDHCLAFVQVDQAPYSPPKPFKFFNFWTKHHEFHKLLKIHGWSL